MQEPGALERSSRWSPALLLLHPSAFVPEMTTVPRLETHFPR